MSVKADHDRRTSGCAVVHAPIKQDLESLEKSTSVAKVLSQNNGLRVPVVRQMIRVSGEVDAHHDCAKQCKEPQCRFP